MIGGQVGKHAFKIGVKACLVKQIVVEHHSTPPLLFGESGHIASESAFGKAQQLSEIGKRICCQPLGSDRVSYLG